MGVDVDITWIVGDIGEAVSSSVGLRLIAETVGVIVVVCDVATGKYEHAAKLANERKETKKSVYLRKAQTSFLQQHPLAETD